MENKQKLGLDIGRGYVKAFTNIDGVDKQCMFKSVVALGRTGLELENEDIFISGQLDNETFDEIFIGILAEKEGAVPSKNSDDSKTTDTVKQLLIAALNEVVEKPEVDIMLGVPNRNWNKKTLNEVIECYKDKIVKVMDHKTGKTKIIHINDIGIFKESDSALLDHVTFNKPGNTNDNVMINVGFRTTEIAFFDNNLKFNDKKSKSLELGNQTVLEMVQKEHPKRSLEEIDSSNRYNKLKERGYKAVSEKIKQIINSEFIPEETNVYACGGVVKYLSLPDFVTIVNDAQMATAKGLYLVATRKFK